MTISLSVILLEATGACVVVFCCRAFSHGGVVGPVLVPRVCIKIDGTTTPIQHTLGDTQYVIPLCVTLMAARWVGNFFNEGAYVRACVRVMHVCVSPCVAVKSL